MSNEQIAIKLVDYLDKGQPTLHEMNRLFIPFDDSHYETRVDGWIDFVDLVKFVRAEIERTPVVHGLSQRDDDEIDVLSRALQGGKEMSLIVGELLNRNKETPT